MEGKDTTGDEQRDTAYVVGRSKPKYVNVGIKEADKHYLASFNSGPYRVFHNVEELLVAIEVEVKRLKP